MKNGSRIHPTLQCLVLVILAASACSPQTALVTPTTAPASEIPSSTLFPTSIPPTSPPTPAEAVATTRIVIDGLANDWDAYPKIGDDPAGDQPPDSPDLAEVRAFCNDEYFYVLMLFHELGTVDALNILMDVDGGGLDYQLGVWPEYYDRAVFNEYQGQGEFAEAIGVTSAYDEVVEVKVPLSLIGNLPVREFKVEFQGELGGDSMAQLVPIITGEPETASSPGLPVPVGTLLDDSLSMRVVHAAGVKVQSMQIGLSNERFFIADRGDTIYQLMDNGQVTERMRFPGLEIISFSIAPDGAFWFTINRSDQIYRVDEHGQPWSVATSPNRYFDFDSQGNVFAVDPARSKEVQKISPTGEVEIVASGFYSGNIAVAPDDRVYTVNQEGELLRLGADGSVEVVASGFYHEDNPAFTPSGDLYIFGEGLFKVDVDSGIVERLEWADRYKIGGNLVFDKAGFGYIFHPNQPLFQLDLQTESLEAILHPRGNSWAMGVDPATEAVFVAYGDHLPMGETILFRVGAEGDLEEVGVVPYGQEESIAFSPSGKGYLSVSDSEDGNAIYTFEPGTGELAQFERADDCPAKGLAVDPTTDELWWVCSDMVYSAHPQTGQHSSPYFEDVNSGFLAFAPDGTLYTLVWFQRPGPNLPAFHGIFRYQDGSWVQLKDMTAKDPGISLAQLTVCPDDHVYVAAGIDGTDITPDRSHSSMSSLLRLEEDNQLTILGYDLGYYDNLAVACAPSGTVYFTNGQGIYSVSGLGAEP